MFRFLKKLARRKYWRYFILLHLSCGGIILTVCIATKRTDKSQSLVESKLNSDGNLGTASNTSRLFRILFWTGYFDTYTFNAYSVDKEYFEKCEVKCQLTFDRGLLTESDAVIFHVRDLESINLPDFHDPGQFWVFYMLESASNTRVNLKNYNNIFNWTMTYRQDSDIYHPYAEIQKIVSPPSFDLTSNRPEPSKKSKLVAWVVSNCFTHSNRESFVRELDQYIQIDKYGACGTLTCVGNTTSECYAYLGKTYKFYLAFENSLCTDYVTEKFFEALRHGMIPVVYGRVNYTAIGPPHSFIDARKFKNMEALATYLKVLDTNPRQYAKFLKWRSTYKVTSSDGWCRLCKKLRDSSNSNKIYSNIYNWWKTYPSSTKGQQPFTKHKPYDISKSACLPYPDYPNESWFQKIRKQYFILPSA